MEVLLEHQRKQQHGWLAPEFTKENAGDMARKAVIAREANRRALREKAKEKLQPAYANKRAVMQVNKVLKWMETENDRQEYAKLATILDRLWNKAYPTQGQVKTRSSNARPAAPATTENTTSENAGNQTF